MSGRGAKKPKIYGKRKRIEGVKSASEATGISSEMGEVNPTCSISGLASSSPLVVEVEAGEVSGNLPSNTAPMDRLSKRNWRRWRSVMFEDWRTNGTRVFAKCKLCTNQRYFSADISSQSNLSRHAKRFHPEIFKQCEDEDSTSAENQLAAGSIEDVCFSASEVFGKSSEMGEINPTGFSGLVSSSPLVVEVVADESVELPSNTVPMGPFSKKKQQRWRYAIFEDWRTDGTKIFAKCKLCLNRRYHAADITSQSNLKRHARKLHPKILKKCEDEDSMSTETQLAVSSIAEVVSFAVSEVFEGSSEMVEVNPPCDISELASSSPQVVEVQADEQSGELPPDTVPMGTLSKKNRRRWRNVIFEDWRTDGRKIFAKCKLCLNRRYLSANITSQSNLKRHARRFHPEVLKKCEDEDSMCTKTQLSVSSIAEDVSFAVSEVFGRSSEMIEDTPTCNISKFVSSSPVMVEVQADELSGELPPNTVPMDQLSKRNWRRWRNVIFEDWRTDGRKIFAKCKLCINQHYHSVDITSQSNLKRHAKRFHLEIFQKCEDDDSPITRKQSLISSFLKPKCMPAAKRLKTDTLLVKMIAEDNLPLSFISQQGFRNLIQALDANYVVPSQERLHRTLLPEVIEKTKQAVKAKLDTAKTCAVMVDIWSSKRMEGYVGISCTAVTSGFEPFTCLLSIRKIIGRHTAATVFAEYERVINEWQLQSKVIRILTASGSNMKCAFDISLPGWKPSSLDNLGFTQSAAPENVELSDLDVQHEIEVSSYDVPDELVEDVTDLHTVDKVEEAAYEQVELDLNSLFLERAILTSLPSHSLSATARASCVAHTLQLVVQDGLKALDGGLKNAVQLLSRIVAEVRKSTHDTRVLSDTVGFQIPPQNTTRWSSQYTMLDTFLEALDLDRELQNKLNASTKVGKLTALQCKMLQELVVLLGPFKLATDAFQKESETTGLVIPAYLDMINRTSADSTVNPDGALIVYCRQVASALHQSLKRRMGYVLNDTCYVLGTVLDPRFKNRWIPLSGRSAEVVRLVKQELDARYPFIMQEVSGTKATTERQTFTIRPLFSTVVVHRTPSKGGNELIGNEKIASELDTYLNEPIAFGQEDCQELSFSPLNYWQFNATRFPILSEIAKDVFVVPASTATVERICSTASDILSAKRNRTKPELFSSLLFIKRNSHVL